MKRIVAFASLIALSIAVALGAGASAQYAPPTGSVTITSSSTIVPTGGSTTLTCKETNANGTPGTGSCTLTIVSEPGSDAGLDSRTITKPLDTSGAMTDILHVGSTPGVIVISAQAGSMQSTLIVTVTGSTTGMTAGSPPASNIEGNTISPPATGDAGLKH